MVTRVGFVARLAFCTAGNCSFEMLSGPPHRGLWRFGRFVVIALQQKSWGLIGRRWRFTTQRHFVAVVCNFTFAGRIGVSVWIVVFRSPRAVERSCFTELVGRAGLPGAATPVPGRPSFKKASSDPGRPGRRHQFWAPSTQAVAKESPLHQVRPIRGTWSTGTV